MPSCFICHIQYPFDHFHAPCIKILQWDTLKSPDFHGAFIKGSYAYLIQASASDSVSNDSDPMQLPISLRVCTIHTLLPDPLMPSRSCLVVFIFYLLVDLVCVHNITVTRHVKYLMQYIRNNCKINLLNQNYSIQHE